MAEIKELSQELSDQIAAGEVIERPSSVVKELVENAIDAASTQISISFVEAGIKEIIIEDNGSGIADNQIDLAFLRHATSKIRTKDDLFRIKTLGFRGEALASISAVAQVEIFTNTGGANGIRAVFQDGRKVSQAPSAAKKGTKIIVRNLFYNTPARLKYLKSEKTEMTKIIDIVSRIALSKPDLAISLQNENKLLLKTSGRGMLRQDVAQVYGRKIASEMIEFAGENSDFIINGLATPPNITRSNRSYISVLLNGRYIKNYSINKAILTGYGSKLGIGKFPIVTLNIQMDPLLVDVNVHPTKEEVRLSKEVLLGQLVAQTIQGALAKNETTPSALSGLDKSLNTTQYDQLLFNLNKVTAEELAPINAREKQLTESDQKEGTTATVNEELTSDQLYDGVQDPDHRLVSNTWQENVRIHAGLLPFSNSNGTEQKMSESNEPNLESATDAILQDGFPALTYIGQLRTGFLIADSDNGFYVVNEKEATRRLNYNRLEDQFLTDDNPQQVLLEPLIFELKNSDYELVLNNLEIFRKVGIYFEDFGTNSLVLKSHPAWFTTDDVLGLVTEILNLYLKDQRITVADFKRQVGLLSIGFMSKGHQKRGLNRVASQFAGQNLLDELRTAKSPYTSPTGKPILVHFTTRDLAKMFKETDKIERNEID